MTLLIATLVGAAAGVMAGVLGIGGGILIPPLLALLLGLPQHTAQAASLAALLPPVGLPALVGYRRLGIAVPWRLVSWLVVGFAAGGASGGSLAQSVPERPLRLLFTVVLFVVAIHTVWVNRNRPRALDTTSPAPCLGMWPGVAIGGIGGLVSGLFGIGGGIIILPLLMRWARIDRLTAQVATLGMMLAPIGLPAVIVYGVANPLPWLLIATVALGFALGAWLGGRLGPRVSHTLGSRLFAGVLLLSALVMLAKMGPGQ